MPTFEKSGRVVTEYHEAHRLDAEAPPEPLLHPDTAPEVVAARQRQDVLVAWGAGLSDPEAIGRALVLPVGSVRRFLFELGLAADPNPGKPRTPPGAKRFERVAAEVAEEYAARARATALDRADRIAKALAAGPLPAHRLAQLTGLSKWQVLKVVVGNPRFAVAGHERTPGMPRPVFGLKAG